MKKIIKGYIIIIMILLLITMGSSICFHTIPVRGVQVYAAAINLLVGSSILYHISPPTVAAVEHIANKPIIYGDCRVKNIVRRGHMLVGYATLPEGGSMYHVRGITPNGEIYDKTCPNCLMENPDLTIGIKDYTVSETHLLKKNYPAFAAYTYLRTALLINKIKLLLK